MIDEDVEGGGNDGNKTIFKWMQRGGERGFEGKKNEGKENVRKLKEK